MIDFVIDKTLPNFSLEFFKQQYNFYSKDLCDEMEEGFIDYLFTFFYDKGMPALATTIKEGSKFRIADDIVASMKMALKPALYNELIENSFYYAPPYLPVYGFMKRFKKWPMLCLTVMEWREEKIKDEFTKYADNLSATHKAETIINHVNKLIASLKWT